MTDLAGQIQRAVLDGKLLSPGDSVVVAVSGGVDSMVLLHILHEGSALHGWHLVVAHFNHMLRGRHGDADERLVRKRAERLGVRFRGGRADVRAWAARLGVSLEMAARQKRHEFLARTARSLGVRTVALAHQADDQLEGFFLRLLRGAGPEGLSGMRLTGPSPVDPEVRLIRPLLGVTRKEVARFARDCGIPFREDATNERLDHERNRVRHRLLPFLKEEFQPNLMETVARLIQVMTVESDFVASQTEEALLARRPFEQLDTALQRRWLRAQCFQLGLVPDFELVEFLRNRPEERCMVAPKRVVWRNRGGHLQEERLVSTARPGKRERKVRLAEGGRVLFDGVEVEWRVEPCAGWTPSRPAEQGLERFDLAKVGVQVRLRHWRPGDRFQPIGMSRPVKVQDLFTNRKIPRTERARLTVAENSAGQIFWIEGLRISEQFKLDASARRCLEWRWRRLQREVGGRIAVEAAGAAGRGAPGATNGCAPPMNMVG